jgi:hypothetical protein
MRLHASILEWLFWATSILIVGLSIWSERQAQLDYDALVEQKVDGDKRLKAQSDIATCYYTISNGLIMLLVSSLSLFQPPPNPDQDYSAQMLSFLFGWILLSFSTALMLLNQRATRRKLMRLTPEIHVMPAYVTESAVDAEKHSGAPHVIAGRRAGDKLEGHDGPQS